MKICDSPLEKREREREMELLKADRGELNKQSSALGRKEARRRREAKNGREREREREKARDSSHYEGQDTARAGGVGHFARVQIINTKLSPRRCFIHNVR
jgi:hypothetical protein